MATKPTPEKVYDLTEAINRNLLSKFSDPGAAAAGGIGKPLSRIDYIKSLGAGEGIFKPESFYTQADTKYTNAMLNLYSAKAKRGWAQRGTKAILEEQKQRTREITDTGRRDLGEKKASSARLIRVTGGLLAGTQAPSMGAVSSGPMLGAEDGLGSESTLGRRTRI